MKDPEIRPDWDSLSFRRRDVHTTGRAQGDARIAWGASIFLGTALLYPWYSYKVSSYLAAREMEVAFEAVNAELKKVGDATQRQLEVNASAAAAASLQQRIASVSVRGTSVVQGRRVVVVTLGTASLAEAQGTICSQAERSFRQPLSGERLRIQVSNGNRPARDAGTLVCD